MNDQSTDSNVESVRQKMLERSRVGLSKYGVTTERTDLSRLDWLRHAQQEMMDSAIYLEVLIADEMGLAHEPGDDATGSQWALRSPTIGISGDVVGYAQLPETFPTRRDAKRVAKVFGKHWDVVKLGEAK